MKNNNQGFTVVELVTSFALAMVVFAFLFEIVVTLKDLYINSGYKTELLYKQAMISNKINTTLFQKKIKIAMTCGDDCLFFVFDDSSTSKLQIDKTNNLFTWGDYTTKLVANSSFGDIYIDSTTATGVATGRNDSIITIRLPITSANIEGKDFGVNIVYQYDSRTSSITGIDSNQLSNGTKAIYLNGTVDDVKIQGNNYNDPGYFVYYDDGRIIYNDPAVTVTSTPVDVLGQSYDITYSIVEEGVTVATMIRKVTVVGTYTYNYTGDVQTFTAPIDGYYKVELWGASGESASTHIETVGLGGNTSGQIYLSEGTNLYVYVGANYDSANSVWNGGGFSETSGGGATDIRLTNGVWNDMASLKSRIMVAGGGGGGVHDTTVYTGTTRGDGGGLLGSSPDYVLTPWGTSAYAGKGGTQTTGGSPGIPGIPDFYPEMTPQMSGQFGAGGYNNLFTHGSGGGGGYYGGGHGTHPGGSWPGGGGGSSFISGYAGVNAITNAATLTHSNNTKHYSNNYFINGVMQSGVNAGNGKAIITYIGKNLYKQNNNLNGVRYIKDCINGSGVNGGDHWVELQAIVNGYNVAHSKTVTGTSDTYPEKPYSLVTDGDINTTGGTGYADAITNGLQCITVDLEKIYNLDEVAIWHYYADGRTYNDHTLSVSLNNTDWRTVINSSVTETQLGQRYNAYTNG